MLQWCKITGVLHVCLLITKSVQVAVGFKTEDLVQTFACTLCYKCHLGFKECTRDTNLALMGVLIKITLRRRKNVKRKESAQEPRIVLYKINNNNTECYKKKKRAHPHNTCTCSLMHGHQHTHTQSSQPLWRLEFNKILFWAQHLDYQCQAHSFSQLIQCKI